MRIARGAFTGIAVSPDGARVAFAANESVGWLPVSPTPEPARVLAKSEGCFISEVAWSPDGMRVAYARLCFDSLAETAILTVPLSGEAATVVVADSHLYNSFVRAAGVVWSPDGEIVYPRTEWLPAEAGSNLWSVPVDPRTGAATAEPRAITSWVGVGAAALTADRAMSRIVFIRFEAQADVYVGALADGGRTLMTPQRLTLSDRNERPSAWSRDGRGVYFFSDASGNFDILYQEVAGGAPRPFANDAEWETLSQLSPDGRSLLYWRFPAVVSDQAIRPEIARRPVDGGPASHVLTAEALAHPAGAGRPSPWETRMRCPSVAGAPCILSEQHGEVLVFTAFDPEHGRGKEVYRVEHPTAASNIWDVSPDGTRLAIPRANGPILIQPIRGGGAPSEVSIAGCDPVTPAWSADGKGLFVSVDCNADDAPFRLYHVTLDGRASLLWKDPSLYILEPVPSPDGQRLAIAVKHSDDDVWVLDGVTRSGAAR
jgi:Tol biopolymer transport system component